MKFDVSAIITIMPIALATMMEHIGDISAIGATTGKNYIAQPGLHRTLLGDGLATCLAAAVGAPANTTYGENTGVLALTKVYDPRVMRIAALFAIALSCIPKVAFYNRMYTGGYHRRNILHPLRHDLRYRHKKCGGKPGGLYQEPQHYNSGPDIGMRPRFQRPGRNHFRCSGRLSHIVGPGHSFYSGE